MDGEPLVCVLTPVYNGEAYLAECIESVLNQTYKNWIYIIVNNCSTDATLSIANRYAAIDPRITVSNNSVFLSSIENHNHAISLIPKQSKYCKIISADDWMFPEFLQKTVSLAEANPNLGIINAYRIVGDSEQWAVSWDGIARQTSVFPGRQICRSQLLGGPYVFGSTTTALYRADLMRAKSPFFPNMKPHADASAAYECLEKSDFGFVHQVLSFTRVHSLSISSDCRRLRTFETSSLLHNLITYGPVYLDRDEYKARLRDVLKNYYRILAQGLFNLEDRNFWKFHRESLAEFGYRCFGGRLAWAVFLRLVDTVFNPKLTLEKVVKRFSSSVHRRSVEKSRETAASSVNQLATGITER